MGREEAEKAARMNRMTGYYHHSYESEQLLIHMLLRGDESLFDRPFPVNHYSDVLAPGRMRAMKNAVICSIALICRAVADYGMDIELSFSLSDYYINQVEEVDTEERLSGLMREICMHYAALVRKEKMLEFPLPVVRSVRYIKQHLYERCSVADVARATGLHPNYLSALFKKELGQTLSRFIRDEKLEEAKLLLYHSGHSIAEIAEMLGYSSAPHFSTEFKRKFGVSPRRYVKGGS